MMTGKALTRWIAVLLLGLLAAVGCLTCGEGGDCPGKVCTNCSGSGDCDMTCTAPEVNFCGHFGYFDDPGLRCSFCARPDYQP